MPPSSAGPVILIADDNRDTREMYALYLSMAGYSGALAEDGHEAVVKARTVRPDLIALDLRMPKVDGWAAMRTLHGDAATARTPIVVLTGHDFKNQRLGTSRSEASAR